MRVVRGNTLFALRIPKRASQQAELLIGEIIDKIGTFDNRPISVPKRKAPTDPDRLLEVEGA
jgi:hypothetical protein